MRDAKEKIAARIPWGEKLLLLAYRVAVFPQGFLLPARSARQTKRKKGFEEGLVFKSPLERREF